MNRADMIFRHGVYCAIAARLLGDYCYRNRWRGRAQELTEADCLSESAEIQSRLVAAGFIGPDEDAYESMIKGRL